jgi:regulator of protease activity HflC (stomatin/prohibitin superfamily)
MNLEQALTGRDHVNGQLRAVLDETTGRWGIRVNRVELKAIEPPASIRDSMEKQMRAERDRRAAILTAEGVKQSKILTAQGEKEAAILRAQGDRESRILQAEGQARAIETVFQAIHEGRPDPELLAYQYLQMLPQIAQGDANKLWIVPSELGRALEGLGNVVGKLGDSANQSAPQPAAPRPAAIKESDAYAERPEVVAAEKAAAEAAANVGGVGLGKTPPNGQQTP